MQQEKERIEAKLKTLSVGSQEHALYTEILNEINGIKLHVADDAICESCQ